MKFPQARVPRPDGRVTRRNPRLESDAPALLPLEEVARLEVVGAELVHAAELGGGLDGEELELGAELYMEEGLERALGGTREERGKRMREEAQGKKTGKGGEDKKCGPGRCENG